MGRSPDSFRVVTEAILLELPRVPRSTWQSWTKREILEASDAHYRERAVVELVVVAQLIEGLGTDGAGLAWPTAKNRVLDVLTGVAPDADQEVDLVVDLRTMEIGISLDDASLWAHLREPVPFPRPRLVVCVGELAQEARRGFWLRAAQPSKLAADKRTKASRKAKAKA